jgi:hypothetical protein
MDRFCWACGENVSEGKFCRKCGAPVRTVVHAEPGPISPDESVPIMRIVGESHYQEALESIAGPKDAEPHWWPVEIQLKREPTNPYDPNAVQCLIDGKLVGYRP